jgi:hypothetical protein
MLPTETITLVKAKEVNPPRTPSPAVPITPLEKQLSPLDQFLMSAAASLKRPALTTVIGNPLARSVFCTSGGDRSDALSLAQKGGIFSTVQCRSIGNHASPSFDECYEMTLRGCSWAVGRTWGVPAGGGRGSTCLSCWTRRSQPRMMIIEWLFLMSLIDLSKNENFSPITLCYSHGLTLMRTK